MKNHKKDNHVVAFLFLLSALMLPSWLQAQTSIVWEDSFTNNVASDADHVHVWNAFVTELGQASDAGNSVTMSGSLDPTGVSCTDPTATQQIADLITSNTTGIIACDGHQWNWCNRGSWGELWIDPPSQCSASNCPDPGFIVRPTIQNVNWGGVGTATCFAPTQTMRLEFGDAVIGEPEPGNQTFAVSLAYTNGSMDTLPVTITCNAGLPLTQSFDVTPADGVQFVVTELMPDEGTSCEVSFSELATGYTASVMANGIDTGTSCVYVGGTPESDEAAFNANGANVCEITAQPMPVEVTITTELVGLEDLGIDPVYETTLECDDAALDSGAVFDTVTVTADSTDLSENIYPSWDGGSECTATLVPENGAVESDECEFTINLGDQTAGCELTGAVFFEGIPTLSQWSLALLAMLMLSLGWFGMRRFI